MRFLGVRFRRIESTQVLLLERIVQPVHQVLELDVRLVLVWIDVLGEYRWIANFSDGFMLARVVSEKVLLARRGHCLVKRRRPTDDAVLIDVDACELVLLQALN